MSQRLWAAALLSSLAPPSRASVFPCYCTSEWPGPACPITPKMTPKCTSKAIFFDRNVAKRASTSLPANSGHPGVHQGRGLLTFTLHCDYSSFTKVPTSADSVFFPAIPAKKDTSIYVDYMGVTKLEKAIFLIVQRVPKTSK